MENADAEHHVEAIPCRLFVGGFDEDTTEVELLETFQVNFYCKRTFF